MTAEEKKMTYEEAKAELWGWAVQASPSTKMERYWRARGVVEGRESGIRESAEKLSGRYGHCPGECRCVYLQEQILALLPDGREKEKQKI